MILLARQLRLGSGRKIPVRYKPTPSRRLLDLLHVLRQLDVRGKDDVPTVERRRGGFPELDSCS